MPNQAVSWTNSIHVIHGAWYLGFRYYIYNHLKFLLKYHSSRVLSSNSAVSSVEVSHRPVVGRVGTLRGDDFDGHRIVGFEVEPHSIVQAGGEKGRGAKIA